MSEVWIGEVGRTGRSRFDRRTTRRRGSAAWGLGRLGLATLRAAEAWVKDVEKERGESD